jgi:hypothetical protein
MSGTKRYDAFVPAPAPAGLYEGDAGLLTAVLRLTTVSPTHAVAIDVRRGADRADGIDESKRAIYAAAPIQLADRHSEGTQNPSPAIIDHVSTVHHRH